MINRQSMLNSSKSSVKIQLLKYVRKSTSNLKKRINGLRILNELKAGKTNEQYTQAKTHPH